MNSTILNFNFQDEGQSYVEYTMRAREGRNEARNSRNRTTILTTALGGARPSSMDRLFCSNLTPLLVVFKARC
jgi:hypothetical protein